MQSYQFLKDKSPHKEQTELTEFSWKNVGGAADVQREREGRSLSVQRELTNQSSQSFTDDVDVGGCADITGKTASAAAAAAATSDVAEDRDDDDDDDNLSYDEQDSVGERSGKF